MKLSISTKKLKELLNSIHNISHECVLHITQDNISCVIVNTRNTELIKVNYPGILFDNYDVTKPVSIGLEVNEVLRKIKYNDSSTILDIYSDNDEFPKTLYFGCNGFIDTINLLDISAMKKEPKIPNILGSSKVILLIQRMNEILKKSLYLSKDDALITFELKNGKFYTSTSELHPTQSVSEPIFFSGVNVKSVYAIEPLLKLCKLIKSKSMVMEFKSDFPIYIKYTVLNEGLVNYFLAPRVNSK